MAKSDINIRQIIKDAVMEDAKFFNDTVCFNSVTELCKQLGFEYIRTDGSCELEQLLQFIKERKQ